MSYISVVADNGFGVLDSWEKVAEAITHDQLIQVTAQEFDEFQLAEECTISRYFTRFYLRNRCQEIYVPIPVALLCNQMLVDAEYAAREGNANDVHPAGVASRRVVRDIWNI